jgi:AraC family transcriptional regulator
MPQLVEMNVVQRSEVSDRVEYRAAAAPIITTQAFDWPGLRLEAGINNIAAVNDVSGMHHYVSMNLDDRPLTMEFKAQDGTFRRVVLRRGSAWVCPADELVSLRVNSNFRYVRMSVDPGYFNRLTTEPDASPVELRRSYAVTKSQIGHILGALIAEADAGNPGGLAFVEALATGLSQQLALHAGVRKPPPERLRGGLSTTVRRRALELIDERLGSSLSVDTIASEVGLSPAHFARAFRETFGLPPHRYLLNLRLERARRMLEAPDSTISDVALSAGFADQAHFTRHFKREYGVTPGTVLRSRRRIPPVQE